ncbi:MAG TPA: hypothetical protein VF187_06725, partial [Gemmatimonadales bacterium]
MRRILIALAGAGLLAGCGRKDQAQLAADSASRDIQLPAPDSMQALNDAPATPPKTDTVYLPAPRTPARTTPRPPAASAAPAPAPAPAPSPPAASMARLAEGTVVETEAVTSITSKTNKPGETFTARIGEAVRSADGRVVIPAGSEVTLAIVAL